MSDIKEEFEKAYENWDTEQHSKHKIIFRKDCALWAAKWMAEYIINNTNAGVDTTVCCQRLKDGSHYPYCLGLITDEINEFVKELQ